MFMFIFIDQIEKCRKQYILINTNNGQVHTARHSADYPHQVTSHQALEQPPDTPLSWWPVSVLVPVPVRE